MDTRALITILFFPLSFGYEWIWVRYQSISCQKAFNFFPIAAKPNNIDCFRYSHQSIIHVIDLSFIHLIFLLSHTEHEHDDSQTLRTVSGCRKYVILRNMSSIKWREYMENIQRTRWCCDIWINHPSTESRIQIYKKFVHSFFLSL